MRKVHIKGADTSAGEFVVLMAVLTSLTALAIDAMLPALPAIGKDLSVVNPNDLQLVVSVLFIGFAVGQLFFGPLSDSVGRKKSIYVGLGVFAIGCLISVLANNFLLMLIGRLFQGVGSASPKIVCGAMVRDRFMGREMARVMSLIMMIFVIVPALAPAIGQGILLLSGWRMIFVSLLVLALIGFVWLFFRQAETLRLEFKKDFTLQNLWAGMRETLAHRISFGYTLTQGIIFGAFIAYLNLSQQILQELFGLGTKFPIYFGTLALFIGTASFANSRLVIRFGMKKLSMASMIVYTGLSILFLIYLVNLKDLPNLYVFMTFMGICFFCTGVLFGNFTSLALEPMGHIAGTASAVIGFFQTLISVALGVFIGRFYNNSVLPLVIGFAVLGLFAIATMIWTEKGFARIWHKD